MARRRTFQYALIFLALFLVGTIVVLSSISIYLSIDTASYLTEDEVGYDPNEGRWNASEHGMVERIPRILHQTWRSETIPDKWKDVSRGCREMMPD
jgi:mannosyltransferase OCH1-like enzyme